MTRSPQAGLKISWASLSCGRGSIISVVLLWVGVLLWTTSRNQFRGQSQSLRGQKEHPNDGIESSSSVSKPEDATHLVIVPGHAALKISLVAKAAYADDAWYLLSYQRKQGFPEIISSHICKGIEILIQDSNSLLIFSGGQTRKTVGPISEAASYYYLAQYKHWADQSTLENRIFLEEYARDSLENLMFSICRFYEVTGRYPQQVTVVGFDFKADRFTNLHRLALAYPIEKFTYIGLEPPQNKFNQHNAESGELQAASSFQRDPYGCHDPTLASKRNLRNPFHRGIPYDVTCPDMQKLLHWCNADLIPPGEVPWGHVTLS